MAIFSSSKKVGQPMGVYANLGEALGYPTKPELPLRNDVIRAYRAYSLKWENARPLLHGTREPWPTIDKVSECGGKASLCEEHLSTLQCTCGVYALTERVDAYEGNVTADVVLFGIVWPYTKGYKASRARIESLVYYPASDSAWEQEIVNALADRYGVAVALGEKREKNHDYDAISLAKQQMAQGMAIPSGYLTYPSSGIYSPSQAPLSRRGCVSCGSLSGLFPYSTSASRCGECGYIQ